LLGDRQFISFFSRYYDCYKGYKTWKRIFGTILSLNLSKTAKENPGMIDRVIRKTYAPVSNGGIVRQGFGLLPYSEPDKIIPENPDYPFSLGPCAFC
jgi:hypothetical protein